VGQSRIVGGLVGGLVFAASASAQLRIVDYNVAGLNGDLTAMRAVFAALNDDDKPGFAVAPAVYVFQEVYSADVSPLLTMLNQEAPPGVTYSAGTYTNSGESGGAQAMFYRGDLVSEVVSGHVDIFTGATRNTDRWKLNLVGYGSPDASFYIYSSHLKASTGSTNEQERLTGVIAIRNNADALPADTHIIYAGDMNIYVNTEPAYQEFISAGPGQAVDPLGSGSWAGAGNAIKHSQAPCSGTCTLVAGGMDDRFDLQLSTAAFHDGEGLARLSGTYRSLGNDGNHYDQSINAGTNTYYPADIPRSDALADALFVASDHVPVVQDYQVPAVMSVVLVTDIGRVIQGAVHEVEVEVSNGAEALVWSGADELDYSATGQGHASGTVGGTVLALAAPVSATFPINTSVVGPATGSIGVTSTSEGAANVPVSLGLTGRILRPSNASFSPSVNLGSTLVEVEFEPDTGVRMIEVPVYNRGFSADQATLDVDGVVSLASPWGSCGSLPTGIESAAGIVCVSFDTTGVSLGDYSTSATIDTSDEDVPGEGSQALNLNLNVSLGIPPVPEASWWGLLAGASAVMIAAGAVFHRRGDRATS